MRLGKDSWTNEQQGSKSATEAVLGPTCLRAASAGFAGAKRAPCSRRRKQALANGALKDP